MSPFVASALLALVAVSSAITLEDCQAKPETGMCRGYFLRHFWNATSGQCEQFVYGGCGGNLNNFENHEECHSTCNTLTQKFASDCESQSEVGLCRGKFPRYFYNQQSGQCESFTYGGCGGNNNNYKSLEECQATCQPAAYAADVKEVECTAEPEKGFCRAAFHKFFFNKHTGKCHPFTYGGCGGNTNKFATEEECQQQCGQTQVEPVDCGAKPEVGLCNALIPAYYYNAKSGSCEHFYYGGCGGNTNRFSSYDSCYSTCQGYEAPETNEVEEPKEWTLNNCFLEPITGNCLAAIPRYYFNKRTGLCERFIYGGCRGNENNFATEKDCYDHCLVL